MKNKFTIYRSDTGHKVIIYVHISKFKTLKFNNLTFNISVVCCLRGSLNERFEDII